jgi:glycerol-3-phosphate cytidylyltransferase
MEFKDVPSSKEFIEQWNPSGKGKIGILFSSFDCMHAGHMMMLKDSANQCDYLIAGLQTDPTIDRPGSKSKPIMSPGERYEMLSSCKYIDDIFIYETEQELHDFIKNFNWDVRILGSDWKGKDYTGHEIKKGTIYFHERNHNYSSTDLRRKIFEAELEKRKNQ